MVKSGVFVVNSSPHKGHCPPDSSPPPQVPPRMKKKGPALPEKPPHLRPSSQIEPKGRNREVLVAASSRALRDKPVEKRQREPAKLLVQTSKPDIDWVGVKGSLEDRLNLRSPFEDRLNLRGPLEDRLNLRGPLDERGHLRKNRLPHEENRARLQPDRFTFKPQEYKFPYRGHSRDSHVLVPSLRGDPRQVVLVPIIGLRGALWCPPPQPQKGVTRSGSLTSQEGSSDDSSETPPFPKSVLKKQKLKSGTVKGSSSCRKGGKNVTFNAFATVQLMEA